MKNSVIVVCTKCGTRNRIPDCADSQKHYYCGKCKTPLPDFTKVGDAEDAKRVIPEPQALDRKEDLQIRKSEGSYRWPAAIISWFKVRDNKLIFSIAALALILHLVVIPYAKAPIYDEYDYVGEAKSILLGMKLIHPEQLSLGKLFIASGIYFFGDNPWGWRIVSMLFAVASIILFYLVCRKLAGKTAAFFSVFLFTFEGFIFNYSSLAMVEVFIYTFMLLSFLFYLKNRYVFSGISLALSGLVKITGLLGVLVILGHWLIKRRAKSPKSMGLLILTAAASFMLLMPILEFAAMREWLNPIDRLLFIIRSSESVKMSSLPVIVEAMQSAPWQWVLIPIHGEWPYYHFRSYINMTVWVMIIPSIGYMVYEFFRKRTDFSLFILLWFASFYFFWMFIKLAVDRVTYHYYFYPSLWAVCAAIGFALSEFWQKASKRPFSKYSRLIRAGIICYLGLHLVFFLGVSWFVPAVSEYYLNLSL